MLDIGCSNFEIPICQVRHAKAVNTNLKKQLKRGNFEIASRETGETPILHSLFKTAGRMPAFLKYNFLYNKRSTGGSPVDFPGNADLLIGFMYGNSIQYANREIGVPGGGNEDTSKMPVLHSLGTPIS